MTDLGVEFDVSKAVELAPRVWWVGTLLPDDQFQCHVYLIEQGDESVLIDPGSALTADDTIRKIDDVVGIENVRWLVCSHADPDILGAIPALMARGLHPDAAIMTHWRDEALIRHSGFGLPFWRIEKHDWQLQLPDRVLRFVFTPYAHFAGSFCTFDESSGTLFSSDLFGGFTDDRSLVATSMSYFDAMREFHEHYMPSRDVLAHAVEQLRELPIQRIAPQHGEVIPEHLVVPIMDRLSQLECGIYLLARDDPGLAFLLTANRTIREVNDLLLSEMQFPIVAERLAALAANFLGAKSMELWARAGAIMLHFEESDGFAGHPDCAPAEVADALSGDTPSSSSQLLLPIRSPSSGELEGVAAFCFDGPADLDRPTRAIVDQIAGLVGVGLEREVLRRVTDLDRAAWYDRAIHDPLTGLHNRLYLTDAARRLCTIDDRRNSPPVTALMIDIDHFKDVNDTYGHPVGDLVLQHVGRSIATLLRPGDIAVRFGGEEFLVLLAGVDTATSCAIGERIRSAVAIPDPPNPHITISVGVAVRQPLEDFEAVIKRADDALYHAKAAGRDRLSIAD